MSAYARHPVTLRLDKDGPEKHHFGAAFGSFWERVRYTPRLRVEAPLSPHGAVAPVGREVLRAPLPRAVRPSDTREHDVMHQLVVLGCPWLGYMRRALASQPTALRFHHSWPKRPRGGLSCARTDCRRASQNISGSSLKRSGPTRSRGRSFCTS